MTSETQSPVIVDLILVIFRLLVCITMYSVVVRYLTVLTQISLTRAAWNTQDFLKREHSLVKPYQGSGFGVPNWDFQGSTMVTSNYIRLTPDDRSRQGAIWNKLPCRVRNWEVQVNFKVKLRN